MTPVGPPAVPSPSSLWAHTVAFSQRIDQPTEGQSDAEKQTDRVDSATKGEPNPAELRKKLLQMIVANEKLRRQEQHPAR